MFSSKKPNETIIFQFYFSGSEFLRLDFPKKKEEEEVAQVLFADGQVAAKVVPSQEGFFEASVLHAKFVGEIRRGFFFKGKA